MYFKNRKEAGRQLAAELKRYSATDTTIIALSDGGAVVAGEIAAKLDCTLTMLLTEGVELPGEPFPLAVIDQDGVFTYNPTYSQSEIEEFDMEYHHYIEQLKLEKLHKLHNLTSDKGLISKALLHGHNIILVSDGLANDFSLQAAADYLKPVKIKRLVVATPLASMPAVDRMHVLCDEIHCLNVVDNYIGTDHYYSDNKLPTHQEVMNKIQIQLQSKN